MRTLPSGWSHLRLQDWTWGPAVCGMSLLTVGTYLLCALLLHANQAIYVVEIRVHATKSVINTAFFVAAPWLSGFIALAGGNVAPF